MDEIWNKIQNNPEYQKNLKKLPEDERKQIQDALKKLVEQWETHLIKPLQNLK